MERGRKKNLQGTILEPSDGKTSIVNRIGIDETS
jgi:hypothetical protein